LSLILHELATNAAKHGVLSGGGGMTVTWALHESFELEWTESGGPALSGNPSRIGFGSRLIRHVVERELGGSVHIDYRPEGLRCSLRAPAAKLD